MDLMKDLQSMSFFINGCCIAILGVLANSVVNPFQFVKRISTCASIVSSMAVMDSRNCSKPTSSKHSIN